MNKTIKTPEEIQALRDEAHELHNSDVELSTKLYSKARRWELEAEKADAAVRDAVRTIKASGARLVAEGK